MKSSVILLIFSAVSLSSVSVAGPSDPGENVMWQVIQKADLGHLSRILASGDYGSLPLPGAGPLEHAVIFGLADSVARLVRDPVIRAAEGTDSLYVAGSLGRDEVVIQLLDAGIPLDGRRGDKIPSPLYGAAQHGYVTTMCLLLLRGAPMDAEAKQPSILKVAVLGGHGAAVRLLLAAGYRPSDEERPALIALAERAEDFESAYYLTRQSHDKSVVSLLCGVGRP